MRKSIKHFVGALVVLAAVGVCTVATPTAAVAANAWCDPAAPFTVGNSTLACEGTQASNGALATLVGPYIITRAFQAELDVYDPVGGGGVGGGIAGGGFSAHVVMQPWSTYSLDAGYQYCLAEQASHVLTDGTAPGQCSDGPDQLYVTNVYLILACKPSCGIPPSPSPTPTSGQTISQGFPPETAPNYAPNVSYSNLYYVTTFGSAPGKMGSTVVGYLYASSSNYVFCKKQYGTTTGPDGHNYWWMYTDLDTGGRGWVSAYYLSNYGNDQAYANGGGEIPICP